ncbi:transmembrane sensor [Pseudomonas sp. JUb42]|jgi:transmembrane sensor|uniref:FecR domain-containing protein n=1 Tax=Pseudomonas sp. JUb42 TaxID=2940611 RepID=UPI00216775F5|nr:FecR domain-containing protein [Pseudomonas sp. JUb42]MCS3472242.1 transmembrane sensor [Pseudomonas sp. JUb42]
MSAALSSAVQEAIDWMAHQRSGCFDPQQQQSFERWLAADRQHQEAWQQLQQRLQATFAGVEGVSGRMLAKDPPLHRRTFLRGALGLGGLAAGSYCLTRPGWQLAGLRADLNTGTAQRERITLPDGSSLLLNAQSAVNLDFERRKRDVELLDGGVIADVQAADRELFRLCSRLGTASLAEGRCMMMLFPGETRVWALHNSVLVTHRDGSRMTLAQGQGARLTSAGIEGVGTPAVSAAAWSQGMLEARDQSLASVIEALRPYHRGVLSLSADAGQLKISGLFSLDHSDQALAAMADVLPLRIERFLGLWTRMSLG